MVGSLFECSIVHISHNSPCVWFSFSMTYICNMFIMSIFTYFTFVQTVPSFLRYAGLQRLSQKLFTKDTTVKVICMGGEPCLNGKQNHSQSIQRVPLCGLFVNCVLCSTKLDNSQVNGSCCIGNRTMKP